VQGGDDELSFRFTGLEMPVGIQVLSFLPVLQWCFSTFCFFSLEVPASFIPCSSPLNTDSLFGGSSWLVLVCFYLLKNNLLK
jgi:hypothetical protein